MTSIVLPSSFTSHARSSSDIRLKTIKERDVRSWFFAAIIRSAALGQRLLRGDYSLSRNLFHCSAYEVAW
ncbi:MAG: hypothetical protein KJZ54_15305, partial [Phycisphaerales bacterium]|nr:hypothetical protein [Phycisphaerales bacterium]